MGCWDDGIMGGDTSWDVAGVMADLLGLGYSDKDNDPDEFGRMHMPEDWDEEDRKRVRGEIEKFGGAAKVYKAVLKKMYRDSPVCKQVLSLLFMSCGATIPKYIRKDIRAACNADEWAKKDGDRATKVAALRDAIASYQDGEAITIT